MQHDLHTFGCLICLVTTALLVGPCTTQSFGRLQCRAWCVCFHLCSHEDTMIRQRTMCAQICKNRARTFTHSCRLQTSHRIWVNANSKHLCLQCLTCQLFSKQMLRVTTVVPTNFSTNIHRHMKHLFQSLVYPFAPPSHHSLCLYFQAGAQSRYVTY